jgi:ElaB/YqjD/DUF883 family membrane-anchored ribosome-binding protein
MFGSNLSKATREMKSLVSQAEHLLRDADSMSGDKADELKKKGARLLDDSIAKVHDLEMQALKAGREMATSANELIHENPWRAMAISSVIAAGVGVALGVSMARK